MTFWGRRDFLICSTKNTFQSMVKIVTYHLTQETRFPFVVVVVCWPSHSSLFYCFIWSSYLALFLSNRSLKGAPFGVHTWPTSILYFTSSPFNQVLMPHSMLTLIGIRQSTFTPLVILGLDFVSWICIKIFDIFWRWKLTSIGLIWHPAKLIESYKTCS